jgi:hypothetical protein
MYRPARYNVEQHAEDNQTPFMPYRGDRAFVGVAMAE